jgi:hypothetical protein
LDLNLTTAEGRLRFVSDGVLPTVAWTTIEEVFEGNPMVRNSPPQVLGERAGVRAWGGGSCDPV